MTIPDWQRVDELFHAALRQPEGEREAWLSGLAGAEPVVLEEVQSLLRADRANAGPRRDGRGLSGAARGWRIRTDRRAESHGRAPGQRRVRAQFSQ